jgi:isopentenyl-diphosphate delta-isomerase
MNESLILVDLMDRLVGVGEKLDTHRAARLHRAFSVFIIHDGKMLLQRRAMDKYHSGGLWANACCSHPRHGQTFAESVQDRLLLELGIAKGVCQPEELFSFVYFADYGELAEYEYDHVLLTDYDGPLSPDPSEIMDVRWVPLDALKQELEQHPRRFSAWFLIAAPRVLAMVEDA